MRISRNHTFSVLIVVFLTCCILNCVEGAKFLLTVPKEIHYDAAFQATVSGVNVTSREQVILEYRGSKDRSRVLNSTVMNFDNNLSQTWSVVFPWSKMSEYGEDSVELTMSTQYVQKKLQVPFSQQTGYIFIQTDKPLYTPRQTVKYRIIAVDEHQRLAQHPLKVDIMNDKLIVVDRIRYTPEEAFQGQEFQLPRETPNGNWTITASFEGLRHASRTAHTATFEVKEYVLPRFSANVKVGTSVITKKVTWITIDVTAKYVYGRDVDGSVDMQLGVWDSKNGTKLLPVRYSGPLTKGVFRTYVQVKQLLPRELFVSGQTRRLYISANVTETSTQEVDKLEDTSTFIAHPYYDINHDLAKTHFKPGFPYTLATQIKAKSGTPASWLKIYILASFKKEDGRIIKRNSGYHHLDSHGIVRTNYDVPVNAHDISFRTVVLDYTSPAFGQTNQFAVPRMSSENNQFLHISLTSPIEKRKDGVLKLRYTRVYPDSNGYRIALHGDYITILIVARGHVVYTKSVMRNNDGFNSLYLPKSLYAEVSPFMRIVAYYHYNITGAKEEFVSDSIRISTEQACMEELSLHRGYSKTAKEPKEELKLFVKGGAKMNVGFAAVDTAVLLLNSRHTLTRASMFEQLGTHDLGEGIGDGQKMEDVLKSSGFKHVILNTLEEESYGTGYLSKPGKREYVGVPKNDGPGGRRQPGLRRGPGPGPLPSWERELTPPQTVRRDFPESWLFENHVLKDNGRLILKSQLPDSITTWSFLAVGVSATRGVCVSQRLEQQVQKLFFVDVRLPFKATRLEVISIKIAAYNHYSYDVMARINVSGVEGICFSADQKRGVDRNFTTFEFKIRSHQSMSKTVKVIPLRNGDLKLRVEATTQNDRDIVEKNLYVVAEGLRVRKSLTFVLDPEAKHATRYGRKRKNRVTLSNTSTIRNFIDTRKKTQKTRIDLAMPKEVIRGTEFCRVSAFGDLMGDIINHAVVKSKSLMDNGVHDAEEVIGDLGPTVHALLYANKSGLMNKELQTKGQRFVRHGVARLLNYREGPAFNLMAGAEQSTWLTAVVLKTLCHATPLAFIDKDNLVDLGFHWLLSQTTRDGTLEEKDWRLADDSKDYKIMLSAEVLIALLECDRSADDNVLELKGQMAFYLQGIYSEIKKPMVLAKVAYALSLFEPGSTKTNDVIAQLDKLQRKNHVGQHYWGDREETNEKKKVPFWYRKGAKASSIEATAYALLVHLHNGHKDVDSIADWLVGQRNDHGSFVGAMDSIAAIQALSFYSLKKQEEQNLKVNLSCKVSFDRQKEYSHSFKFTEKNAIRPELLSNVPVGQSIEVNTKGEGLGQMQVNVEYNVPYDQNENCHFNVTVEIKSTKVNFFPGMAEYPLCMYCSLDCPKPEEPEVTKATPNCTLMTTNGTLDNNSTLCVNATATSSTATNKTTTTTSSPEKEAVIVLSPDIVSLKSRPTSSRRGASQPTRPVDGASESEFIRIRPTRNRMVGRTRLSSRSQTRRTNMRLSPKPRRTTRRNRNRRSLPDDITVSRRSICIHVCLEHLAEGDAGETRIDIEMLTGYYPILEDVKALNKKRSIKSAAYIEEKNIIVAVFKKVVANAKTCLAFRALDIEEVERPTDAAVILTETGEQDPSCVLKYHPPLGQTSLQVYCADFNNINRGECRCYSGICSSCAPYRADEVRLQEASQMVCDANIGYQVQVTNIQDRDQWVEIEARVLSLNKTGSHDLTPNDHITLISPSSCPCPTSYNRQDSPLYLLSSDVERMVDRHGKQVHRYLLDENSQFLRVQDPHVTVSKVPSVPHFFLQAAFGKNNKC